MENRVKLYQSAEILCRRCLEVPVSDRELAEVLDRYLEEMDEDLRVSPEAYEARLAVCEPCPHRVGYTCLKCGCYVQARSAKKKSACPVGRWK
ncbi:MAG: hypothetical protein E7458_06925 [Ruminococcaceae bacterium]|nr:hypothetical protein [Oscillospiraceae bacterium]